MTDPDPQPRTSLAPGMLFAGYRLEAELGRGGMGTVFLAQQPGLQRQVALKVLSAPLLLVSERALWRFQREARLLAALDHPGIVKVLEASVHEGIPFFVMELVRGASFADVLAAVRRAGLGSTNGDTLRAAVLGAVTATPDTTPPWTRPPRYRDAVLDIVADTADALACAHAAGVVHRDVKPSNLLLRSDGAVLLADFGVAHQDGGTQLTVTGDLAGTPTHMSPEQARGEAVDHRSDVFSLGIVLYEALTLQLPFPGDSQAAILDRLLHHEPIDPLRLDPTLGRDTAAVLGKALEKEPNRRYQTASAFAADLRAARAGLPVTARRPGPLERLWRWARREPWQATAAAIAIVALATVVTIDRLHTERLRAEGERTAQALAEVQRLAIGVRLKRAEADGKRFRVARFEDVPAMQQWLREQAEPLAAELPALERLLETLRREALPYGEAEAAADRANSPDAEAMAQLEQELALREARLASGHPDRELNERRRSGLLEVQAVFAERLAQGRSWRFAAGERQFLHDQVAALVPRLQAFGNGVKSQLQHIRDQIAWATEAQQRCVVAAAPQWQEVAADVAADPRFGGLALAPQRDLLPIGKDPVSGLWEFVHMRSGSSGREVPPRNDAGTLVPTEDMGIVFTLLPGGTFAMGAQNKDPQGRNYYAQVDDYEGPVRDVTLDPFFCGKYEVTQAQWSRIADGETPSRYHSGTNPKKWAKPTPLHPVESVSQRRAQLVLGNHGLALPTEAQWEYACRAGTSTPFAFGDRQLASAYANFSDAAAQRSGSKTTIDADLDDGFAIHGPIGSLRPNTFGLHDLHGNVAELVDDFSGWYWRPALPHDGRTQSAYLQTNITARGGTFAHPSVQGRSSARRLTVSWEFREANLGVRAVRRVER